MATVIIDNTGMRMNNEQLAEMAVNIYQRACNALAKAVSNQLFADPDDPQDEGRDFYWVGDEVGGLCDFGDSDFLNPTEMMEIIENKVTYEQYSEWRDALLDKPKDTPPINLHSWLMGCRYDMVRK